jgi:hypothetical protein
MFSTFIVFIVTSIALVVSVAIVRYLDREEFNISVSKSVSLQLVAMFGPFFSFIGTAWILSFIS